MNERIEQLALQAREYADELIGSGLSDFVWQDRYHEKFAELIVQDCAGIADDLGSMLFCHNDKSGSEIAYSIRDSIKNHFGVE